MNRHLWLAAWLLATAVHAQSPSLAAGDAALSTFDLETALASYRAVCTQSPTNYEAAWKLARALIDKATLTQNSAQQKLLCVEAEELARRAVRLKPEDSTGHAYLAIALGKRALFEGGKRKVELSKEVKTEAEKAIALNPKEDLAHHVLGVWNRELAQLSWVLKEFAEILYGGLPPASLETSEAELRRAVELSPKVLAHHVELGITLAATRQRDDAVAEFDKALALPKGWVTDDHYRTLAQQTRDRIKPRP